MARRTFHQGQGYYAGFDKPFFAPLSAIVSAVEKKGFDVVFADECDAKGARLPFAPPSPCGDGWDYLAFVVRTAGTANLEVPSEVKWILEVPKKGDQPAKPIAPLPAPAPQPPAPGSRFPVVFFAGTLTAGAVLAALAWWGERRR